MDGELLPKVDDAFGHYVAGFADGEGCFIVVQRNLPPRPTYFCRFIVRLRDDDSAILGEIRERLGVGDIFHDPRPEGINGQTIWQVSRMADCLRLVEFFTRYPLRAKKARDFKVWKAGVAEWQRVSGLAKDHSEQDWTHLGTLKKLLEATRVYRGSDLVVNPVVPIARSHQGELWEDVG